MARLIEDPTVNSYNAEIKPNIDTPEKRLSKVNEVVNQNFKVTEEVKFRHMKEFDRLGTDLPPSLYWVFTFKTPSIEGFNKLHTATLANDGMIEFNLHAHI
jgi:hypothetical protein